MKLGIESTGLAGGGPPPDQREVDADLQRVQDASGTIMAKEAKVDDRPRARRGMSLQTPWWRGFIRIVTA